MHVFLLIFMDLILQGVRYTALEGEVDPLKIAEILNRYFGTRTS